MALEETFITLASENPVVFSRWIVHTSLDIVC